MKLDDIIALVKAGYTAEDIKAMDAPEEVPEEIPAEDPEAVPEEAPASAPDQPEQADVSALFKTMLNELQGMREDLRKRAVLDDSTKIEDPIESANRILAEIIDPPVLKPKEGKKGKK